MQRRDFVKKAAVGAVAGATLAGCGGEDAQGGAPSVQARPTVRWKLASSFPRSLDTIYGAAEVLAERVSQLTDDRFQIRPYPGGEIVPAFEVLGAVQTGTVQMGHSASYYFKGKDAAFVFDTTVPFGLTARQYNAWAYYGEGKELLRELFGNYEIVNLPGGNTGTQMGGWFRDPIEGLSDMQGLRMRIPGLGGEVMSRMGVNVQNISGGEIYPALERGAIDAVEWVGPYDDARLGFHEIVKNYYYPGWWEPGPALTFYVNRAAWEQLPSEYQQIMETAASEANVRMLAKYDAVNPPALERLVQQGVRLQRFPDAVMQEAQRVTAELLESQSSGELYDRIYESYKNWRDASYRWFSTAEQAYADFSFENPALVEPLVMREG